VDIIVLLGRICLSVIFIAAAPRHFTAEGIAHAAARGVPLASLAVPLSGIMALAGGLSLLLGYRASWGAWLLVAFLVPVTVMMHQFWRQEDPAAVHVQLSMFMKNVALLGAALLVTQFGAGPFSLDARRAQAIAAVTTAR
jgi:putative oxidoreductase